MPAGEWSAVPPNLCRPSRHPPDKSEGPDRHVRAVQQTTTAITITRTPSPGRFVSTALRVPTSTDTRTTRYPVVRASVYPPGGRRSRWQAKWLCPRCGYGETKYGQTEIDLAGVRSPRCGHGPVRVVIARTYQIREVPS